MRRASGIWLVQTVLGLVAAGVGLAVVPSSAQTLQRRGVTLRPLRDARYRVELAAVWLPTAGRHPWTGCSPCSTMPPADPASMMNQSVLYSSSILRRGLSQREAMVSVLP